MVDQRDEAPEADRGTPPASELLRDVADKARPDQGGRVTIGELLDGAGPRVYGIALIVLALPEAIPIPAAGITSIVAIPLFVLSAWMTAFGLRRRLPGWIRRRSVKRTWVDKAVSKGTPWVRRLERVSRPRLQRLAEAGRPLGAVCLVLTAVMSVPVPFSNVGPAWCVIALGLGIFQQDGGLVLVALIAAVAVVGATAYLWLTVGRILL